MQRHPAYTRARIAALLERLHALVHAERSPLDELRIAGPTARIPAAQAERLAYRPARLGEELGPLWATHWLRASGSVPAGWGGARVDLLFASFSEATLRLDGRPLQGLNTVLPLPGVLANVPEHESLAERGDALLLERAQGGERVSFLVEIACNGFRGDVEARPFAAGSPFRLERCQLARFDAEAHDLAHDLDVLAALEREEDLDPAWRGLLLSELNRFCNACDAGDRATWPAAGEILRALLGRRNAAVTHELSALGHAHIDTAFLWPLAESRRKCARTFASQLRYMERYPGYRFACSQAVHYAWMRESEPQLWRRIRERIAAGQWLPVGGSWVESDCNLPSGESLVRQLLVGQRFFERELGGRASVYWNPDAFGYNGQLPQIVRGAGMRYLLTQKLSLNRFDPPQMHSFFWEGLDGSRLLVHIPPIGTYNSSAELPTLRAAARAYADHDRSRHSLLLFGHGDGGGGPTPRMLEILRRVGDLEGVPRTEQRPPQEFFSLLEAELERDPLVVRGELYLELHRGTYTSQARTKLLNRRCERALHDAELAWALAHRLGRGAYPGGQLDALWRALLLHQFHDVLPGSSIREVHEQAERELGGVLEEAERLTGAGLAALAEEGAAPAPFNTTGHARVELAEAPGQGPRLYELPPHGAGRAVAKPAPVLAQERDDGSILLANRHLRALVGRDGSLLSLVHLASGREALSAPGNRLELYEDRPTLYDAWDVDPFHLETRRDCPPAHACELRRPGPLRTELAFERAVGGASSLRQLVRLDAESRRLEFHCELDWRERHRLLKVAFPLQVRASEASFEMQFGVARRPTHFSSARDLARFEVPGHRFADLSEHGFGVALLSDCKYGYSAHEHTLRISLMRAPTAPDAEADQGRHGFAYAAVPHEGGWQEGGVVAEAAAFNAPLPIAAVAPRSFARVEDPNLVLDTVKRAEDRESLVLRLYEAHGSRGRTRLELEPPPRGAWRCNLLEDRGAPLALEDGAVLVDYRPFEIVTLEIEG